MNGWNLIQEERDRQKTAEGFSPAHDARHNKGELAAAAECFEAAGDASLLAGDDVPPPTWPWTSAWWKPRSARRNLERAGALYLAEADRLTAVGATSAAYRATTCARRCAAALDRLASG